MPRADHSPRVGMSPPFGTIGLVAKGPKLMMPKVALLAPEGVRGQIHASHSGQNYDVDEDGVVIVNHVDVAALLNGGYQHVPRHPSAADRDLEKAPISSVSFGSHESGATAIDRDQREARHRDAPQEALQPTDDHGDAIPPHGEPGDAPSTVASRAEAQEEVDAAHRAGADPEHRSAVAETGNMSTDVQTRGDQEKAREPSGAHDGAYGEFKDHAGQEGEAKTIRGKTKDELDARDPAGA